MMCSTSSATPSAAWRVPSSTRGPHNQTDLSRPLRMENHCEDDTSLTPQTAHRSPEERSTSSGKPPQTGTRAGSRHDSHLPGNLAHPPESPMTVYGIKVLLIGIRQRVQMLAGEPDVLHVVRGRSDRARGPATDPPAPAAPPVEPLGARPGVPGKVNHLISAFGRGVDSASRHAAGCGHSGGTLHGPLGGSDGAARLQTLASTIDRSLARTFRGGTAALARPSCGGIGHRWGQGSW